MANVFENSDCPIEPVEQAGPANWLPDTNIPDQPERVLHDMAPPPDLPAGPISPLERACLIEDLDPGGCAQANLLAIISGVSVPGREITICDPLEVVNDTLPTGTCLYVAPYWDTGTYEPVQGAGVGGGIGSGPVGCQCEDTYDALYESLYEDDPANGAGKIQENNDTPLRPICLYRFNQRGAHNGDIAIGRIEDVYSTTVSALSFAYADSTVTGTFVSGSSLPILKGSVAFSIVGELSEPTPGMWDFVDDGAGGLSSSLFSGTIDYATGAFQIDAITLSYPESDWIDGTYRYMDDDLITDGYNCFVIGSDGDYQLSADVMMDYYAMTSEWESETCPFEFSIQFYKRQYLDDQPVDTAVGERFSGHDHGYIPATPAVEAHTVVLDGGGTYGLPAMPACREQPILLGAAVITPNSWALEAGDVIMLKFRIESKPASIPGTSGGWAFIRGQMAIAKCLKG